MSEQNGFPPLRIGRSPMVSGNEDWADACRSIRKLRADVLSTLAGLDK